MPKLAFGEPLVLSNLGDLVGKGCGRESADLITPAVIEIAKGSESKQKFQDRFCLRNRSSRSWGICDELTFLGLRGGFPTGDDGIKSMVSQF